MGMEQYRRVAGMSSGMANEYVKENIEFKLTSSDVMKLERGIERKFCLLVVGIGEYHLSEGHHQMACMTDEGRTVFIHIFDNDWMDDFAAIQLGMVVSFDGAVFHDSVPSYISVQSIPVRLGNQLTMKFVELPDDDAEQRLIVGYVDQVLDRSSDNMPARVRCYTAMGDVFFVQSFIIHHIDQILKLVSGTLIFIAPASFKIVHFKETVTMIVSCYPTTVIHDAGMTTIDRRFVREKKFSGPCVPTATFFAIDRWIKESIVEDITSFDEVHWGAEDIKFTFVVLGTYTSNRLLKCIVLTKDGRAMSLQLENLGSSDCVIMSGMVIEFRGGVSKRDSQKSVYGCLDTSVFIIRSGLRFNHVPLPTMSSKYCAVIACICSKYKRIVCEWEWLYIQCITNEGRQMYLKSGMLYHIEILEKMIPGTVIHVGPVENLLEDVDKKSEIVLKCCHHTVIFDTGKRMLD